MTYELFDQVLHTGRPMRGGVIPFNSRQMIEQCLDLKISERFETRG